MNIPEPTFPSEEEMKEFATNWWKTFEGINFLDYNDIMTRQSIPFTLVHIPRVLIDKALESVDYAPHVSSKAVQDVADHVLSQAIPDVVYNLDFFIKTITVSPKDEVLINRYSSIKTAFTDVLFSVRCFDHLCLLRHIDMVYLVFRPYVSILPKEEFRVFVKDGAIAGISQYYYDQDFRYGDGATEIGRRIREYVTKTIIPCVSVETFCLDLWVTDQEIKVIETNPYYMSDPCLFKSHENMKGGFKCVS